MANVGRDWLVEEADDIGCLVTSEDVALPHGHLLIVSQNGGHFRPATITPDGRAPRHEEAYQCLDSPDRNTVFSLPVDDVNARAWRWVPWHLLV
jgi:hypothetical protein